jgi:hypothetical protein
MSKSKKNLLVWEQVQETDTKFTKADHIGSNKGFTSINGVYMFKRATEIFGPVGIGWGYNILEERFDEGGPFKDKEGNSITSKNHTVKLELWYRLDGEKGSVVNFGHTKYLYKSKYGYTIDEEAPKKSLTDAIKKCLSMLGFSSDIFMGMFEDPEYLKGLEEKSELEHADDKDAVRIKQINEHQEWIESELKCYTLIDSVKPLKTVLAGHKRKCARRNDEEGQKRFQAAFDNRVKEIEECK